MFADHYSSSAVVVGVNEAVGEGFADGFVLGRVIDAVKSFKAEWNFEVLDNAGDYAAIEIENVATPVSRCRPDTVGPFGDVIYHFPKVKEIVGIFADYFVFVAKYEKSGPCGVGLAISVTDGRCSYLDEEFFIREVAPRVVELSVPVVHSECQDALRV